MIAKNVRCNGYESRLHYTYKSDLIKCQNTIPNYGLYSTSRQKYVVQINILIRNYTKAVY